MVDVTNYHLWSKTSYELDQPPADHHGLIVHRAADEHWADDFAVDRPHLRALVVMIVRSGRLFQGSGRTGPGRADKHGNDGWEVGPGDAIVLGNHQPRLQRVIDSAGLGLQLVHCDTASSLAVLAACGLEPVQVIRRASDCLPLFGETIAACRRAGPQVHAMTSHLVTALLHRLGEIAVAEEPVSASQRSGAYQQFLRCRRILWQDHAHLTSVNQWAQRCAVDPAYLSRLFQRFAEEAPGACLRRLRLRRVQELVESTDLSIGQIADELGYSDPYTMSRAFRQAYGCPPSQLRQPG